METLIAFAITLVLISVISIRFRISPFFTLIGGSILFGLLAGLTLDATLQGVIAGIGKIFSAFGIIILCGAVIARLLQEQHQTEEIVSDIRQRIRNPPVMAGVSGYLLAVPITCCITAYIMLNPILDNLEKDPKKRAVLLYLTAIGAIISYALVYPTPVVIPLFNAFSGGMHPLVFDAVTIPVSLVTLAGILLFFRWWCPDPMVPGKNHHTMTPDTGNEAATAAGAPASFHPRAWAPFIAIVLSVPVALFYSSAVPREHDQFHHACRSSHRDCPCTSGRRSAGLSQGAKHAGIIIFDICGAGALGFVIVQSGFAQAASCNSRSLSPSSLYHSCSQHVLKPHRVHGL